MSNFVGDYSQQKLLSSKLLLSASFSLKCQHEQSKKKNGCFPLTYNMCTYQSHQTTLIKRNSQFSMYMQKQESPNGSPFHENHESASSTGSDAGASCQIDDQPSQSSPKDSQDEESSPQAKSAPASPLGENSLVVDISDALSEKDKVKFTVHTRTTIATYAKQDFFVVRQHEEFVWLHDRYEENEEYAGYIVSGITSPKIFFLWSQNGESS